MTSHEERMNLSERGAWVSIIVYIVLAAAKLLVGFFLQSASLTADGVNNFTDVISSVTVLIGLKTARKPADHNHPYGHWKAEAIASLVTSFIMLFLGLQLLITTATTLFSTTDNSSPGAQAAIVSLISMLIMFAVSRYNHSLAKKSKSHGLKAVAKDNFVDGLTSLATAVAILTASVGMAWVDDLMALIIALIIFKTGLEIFKESTFSLSDGFDVEVLPQYKKRLLQIKEVHDIPQLKARMYGANIYVDITILVNGNMTVRKSHEITEAIEMILYHEFDVQYTDVHVEPHDINSQFSKEQM